ncbi:winged helix-turn-helix domain-containing protein, partial [Corynebacterium sp. 35RC1]|nr:winged helix-turn-helix domain-containing protein [Corynebacterium sp. 35RC1]
VVARVQAVLRRSRAAGPQPGTPQVLRAGIFQIDPETHEATVHMGGQSHLLDLTLTEFKLLACLMRSPRRVFSRLELLESCLPEGDTLERTVDSHISKLRKKLEAIGATGLPVSVRGVGYRLGSGE